MPKPPLGRFYGEARAQMARSRGVIAQLGFCIFGAILGASRGCHLGETKVIWIGEFSVGMCFFKMGLLGPNELKL